MTAADLLVTALGKRYPAPGGEIAVLDGVSFAVPAGATVAITGPSGSGKSTLLNLIGTLDAPNAGSVRLGDVEVTALSGDALAAFRARRLGFVFQDHHLLPQLTAEENVLIPALAAGRAKAAVGRARDLLERLGLGARAGAFPFQLSGGERQRVAVARALINGPDLLLCDEPTGNLDRDHAEEVATLILELAAAQGATVLIATHDLALAARCGRRLALNHGRTEEVGA
jgi:ABC-type lipoprotein export system ATPase subunit